MQSWVGETATYGQGLVGSGLGTVNHTNPPNFLLFVSSKAFEGYQSLKNTHIENVLRNRSNFLFTSVLKDLEISRDSAEI